MKSVKRLNGIVPCCRGFTLIELLVVIAITPFLGAFFPPAIAKPKRKAVRFACKKILKQIVFLVHFYTEETRNIFPPHRNKNEKDNPPPALTNWWGTAVIGYARNQS